ncbi:Predicted permease [Fibrobacter sp. UWB15]|uniref:permease n=1 Tax=unclassified Fibrobacter TaxID=2634177 RepID=UPI00090ECA8B|nr:MULTISPECIES: permease [unclassified Fibrobacter]PWJ64533.1 putative permease [Fibrobacter sp. UWB6]SHG16309.1 Predicted permease [Fibrobacter sp. UWB8]SMG32461.1 Predicted permease [Fibrobacter sp. UWB15]
MPAVLEILEKFVWQFITLFSILATYSLLGGTFAILRPVAAFVTAMLGGVFTNLVTKNEPETGVAVIGESHEHHHEHHNHEHCDCEGDHCSCGHDDHDEHEKKSFAQKLKETFEYGFVNMIGDVSKWLTIGLLLGALIAAFVPDDFFLFLHEYPLLCMLVVKANAIAMITNMANIIMRGL